MSGLGAHTGNSAEDAMSNAASCFGIALIVIVLSVIGGIVLLVRHFA